MFGAFYLVYFGAMLIIIGTIMGFGSAMAGSACSKIQAYGGILPFNPCSAIASLPAAAIALQASGIAIAALAVFLILRKRAKARHCPKCGTEAAASYNYCPKCGEKLGLTQQAAGVPEKPPA